MTEEEALKKVIHEAEKLSTTVGYKGYCTKCGTYVRRIIFSDVRSMETECVECYAKRRMTELAPQITESDTTEVKKQRAQTVRDYFAKRRSTQLL